MTASLKDIRQLVALVKRQKTKWVRLILLVLCPLSFALCPLQAADNVKDLQNKQKKLQQEIEQTNKMLKQTKTDEKATLNKLQLLGQNIQNQKIKSQNQQLN